MIRIVLSPLFIGLIALVVGQAVIFRHWRQLTRLERRACLLLAFSTGMLLVAGLPIVANLLMYSLERQYKEPIPADLAAANAVVLLEGGYVKGRDPSRDRLGGAASRVLCGVRGFQSSGAKWLVLSGRERPVELMRDLALELGVLPEQIVLESSSRHTFQRPIEVRELAQVRGVDTIAVASDAFHLPRALGQFHRYFPRVVPIPCDVHAPPSVGLREFLPQAGALSRTTAMLQEYLGMAWYTIRRPGD